MNFAKRQNGFKGDFHSVEFPIGQEIFCLRVKMLL